MSSSCFPLYAKTAWRRSRRPAIHPVTSADANAADAPMTAEMMAPTTVSKATSPADSERKSICTVADYTGARMALRFF